MCDVDEKQSEATRGGFDLVNAATKLDGPHAWIQWKGTDVCMDVHCVCGASMHVDGEFVYGVGCPHCGRTFAVGAYVRLVELTDPAHVAAARDSCFVQMDEDPDYNGEPAKEV